MVSYTRNCMECGVRFVPKDARVIFCTRSCGARWKMKQPEIVERMIAGKDLDKVGQNISKAIRSKPKELARRRRFAKNVLLKIRHTWTGSILIPTKQEQIILECFPDSQYGFVIPIGRRPQNYYKLDVSWPLLKLDVEIDGYSHNNSIQKEKDKTRTQFLKQKGWCVLRFTHREIKYRLPEVKAAIESAISRLKAIQATS